MCNQAHMFNSIKPIPSIPFIYVADGSKVPCKGIGTLDLLTDQNHHMRVQNVLYVPDLQSSLFSVLTHIQHEGCELLSENKTTDIKFRSFTIPDTMGHDMSFQVSPGAHTDLPIVFEATSLPPILQ